MTYMSVGVSFELTQLGFETSFCISKDFPKFSSFYQCALWVVERVNSLVDSWGCKPFCPLSWH